MAKHSKPQLPGEVQGLLLNLHDLSEKAYYAKRNFSNVQRETIQALHQRKMSCREIAALIGISHQRVNQILKEKEAK